MGAEGAHLYLDGYTYYYDTLGRVAQIDSYIFGPTTYTYDAQDQLTAATPAYYYAPETYAYDATGNRNAVVQNQTLRDYAVGPGNRSASDGVFTYSYDAEGNLIYRESIADGSYTIYWYDYRNRILGTASCAADGVNTSFSYFMYDAYDRLVRISRDLDGVGAMAATDTFFVHDGTSILFQFNGSRSQDLANRYLHAEAVDLVLADENLTTGKTHWMLTDHLGTIRHMVNFAYGAWQGARFGMQRAYDAFGQILAQGQPFDTIFAYTGQLLDKPTAMQYHQHRWYNPGIGRWMSEDPIGFEGGDVNPGRYVGNNSTNLVDPSGLQESGSSVLRPLPEWLVAAEAERRAERAGRTYRTVKIISPGGSVAVEGAMGAYVGFARYGQAMWSPFRAVGLTEFVGVEGRLQRCDQRMDEEWKRIFKNNDMAGQVAGGSANVAAMFTQAIMVIGGVPRLLGAAGAGLRTTAAGTAFADTVATTGMATITSPWVTVPMTVAFADMAVHSGKASYYSALNGDVEGSITYGGHAALSLAFGRQCAQSTRVPQRPFLEDMTPSEAARYREYWGGKHEISGAQPFGRRTTVTRTGQLKTVTTFDQYGRPHRQYGIREGEPLHEHGFTYPKVPQPGTGLTPRRGPQRPIGSNE